MFKMFVKVIIAGVYGSPTLYRNEKFE